MSRVREFEKLHLLNYDPKKVKASEEVKLEMNRLRQQPCPSTVKNIYDVNAQLKIAYINAQSLYRHKMDVEHDFNLSNADVLFCSETRFQESDAKSLTEILVYVASEMMQWKEVLRDHHMELQYITSPISYNSPQL